MFPLRRPPYDGGSMNDVEVTDPLSTDPSLRGGCRSREHWIVVGVAAATLAGLLVLAFAMRPDERGYGTHEQLGLQPCLPMELWHVPCPGCGVTTSVAMAVRGDLLGSLRNQPFGFLMALLFVALAVWAPLAHFLGRDLWRDVQAIRFGLWTKALVIFVALSWVYKLALVRGWFGG